MAILRQYASLLPGAAKKLEEDAEPSQVPEGLSQVHEGYKAGAEELSTALSDYVEAYASFGILRTPIRPRWKPSLEIQARYDSGIEHLSKADALVAEYAGDGSSSQDNAAKDAQDAS